MRKQRLGGQASFRSFEEDPLEVASEVSLVGGWHDNCPRSPLSSVEGRM